MLRRRSSPMMRRWALVLAVWLPAAHGARSPETLAQVDKFCAVVPRYLRANRPTPASPSFVFRCRMEDNCGGLGDQMAGMASAAYIAFRANRSLKADVPGLQTFFTGFGDPSPPIIPMEYPPVTVDRPHRAQVIPIEGSPGAAMVNSLNGGVDASVLPKLLPYRTVYYHSNRAVGTNLLPSEYSAIKGEDALWQINHCILRTLFRPRRALLNHTVDLLGSQPITIREMVDAFQREETVSVGIHVRISDGESRSNETALRGRHAETVGAIEGCVARMTAGRRHAFVYVSTNSLVLGGALLERFAPRAEARVLAPRPSTLRHTNILEWPEELRNASLPGVYRHLKSAVVQSLVDIWMLSRTNALLFSVPSGFSMAAALISETPPLIMHLGHCMLHQPLCMGRFC